MAHGIFFRRTKRRLLVGALMLLCVSSAYIAIVQPLLRYRLIVANPPPTGSAAVRIPSKASLTSSRLTHETGNYRTQSGQACVHPTLELWPPEMVNLFGNPSPLECHQVDENWVDVENGTFRILPAAQAKHGKIWCELKSLVRRNDLEVDNGTPIRPMPDGAPIPADFFETRCVSADGSVYKNIHSGIHMDTAIHEAAASKEFPEEDSHPKMNILMFGFDSLSRMTYLRNLPETYEYLVKVLGGVVLEGYNIVGDGTPQALLPILTGQTETELPEARRGFQGANYVDGHPWIWKDLKNLGYVTQWGEDGSAYGTFTYRMKGFKDAPVDHYMRPFYMRAENTYYRSNKPYCLGSKSRHLNMINWARDLFLMYQRLPKFSFLFHSEFTHNGYSQVRVVDSDLKEFLQFMNENGYLDNTMLVLMSDHGARFQTVRQSTQGKYEERMPFFSVRMPPWWSKKYPEALTNLQINSHRLTTPFDIHATFHDIIKFSGSSVGNVSQRAISLFKEIPSSRTCQDAGIEPHWCACLNWVTTSVRDAHVIAAARSLVDTINSLTESHRNQCVSLVLDSVQTAGRYQPNNQLLKFKQSADTHGRVPDLSDDMQLTEELFQVSITTRPSGAKYEATLKHTIADNSYVANSREISRINKYGNQPHCVMKRHPHLRPYCYCNVQL